MRMELKLEITRKLEKLATPSPGRFRNRLRESVAILNLPAPYYCEKGCSGCCNKGSPNALKEKTERLPLPKIKEIMDFFSSNYQTDFITINGRGDPFHPAVAADTMEKIAHAKSRRMQAYIFTSGDNLSEGICRALAESRVNVMISLLGNKFLDADFFRGAEYVGADREVAENIRLLLRAYNEAPGPAESGTTRLGMNYVVSAWDLKNPEKLRALKAAANENGIFFVCNVDFFGPVDPELSKFANENSNFGLSHSTFVDGRCQMGAGSSITIAANGDIYRCPYMLEGSDGKITEMSEERMRAIIYSYLNERKYSCVIRKT